MKLLFQGDSITDAGRNREQLHPNEPSGLGAGYANHIASRLLCQHPSEKHLFLNRGISGNRVVDLYARWKVDAVNLEPDVISILIGVNDIWHELFHQNGVDLKRFDTIYRLLLEFTKDKLPKTKLVLCEPFLLPCGLTDERWFEDMKERRAIVKKIAEDTGATFVPFQTMFDNAQHQAPADYWAKDGVHPTPAGHQLMAKTWLKHIKL
ncbi:MAG: SGNH/GDSL hydrolase family protein [Trueperaceae bacterium]